MPASPAAHLVEHDPLALARIWYGFMTARVTIALESRYAFPKDSSLKILTSGLLGEQYLGLEAGASDTNLVAGDVIGATQSAVVLENLISQFLFSKAAEGADPGTEKK